MEKIMIVTVIHFYQTFVLKLQPLKIIRLDNPSIAFVHSDRKKRASSGRHNFVTSIL
jgi:hypothetical protein